jgi:ankyrin repeat protein
VTARDNDGQTPLHFAARGGWVDVAGILIDKGADVNAKDKAGRTPLALLEAKKDSRMIEFLRKKGTRR